MRPVVCLISDDGIDSVEDERLFLSRVEVAARAGVALVQVRQPTLDTRRLSRLVSGALLAVRGTPARVLVNDRLDVALATGAHGLHLRSSSYAAARARRIAPRGFLIGRSVHDIHEACEAGREDVDYLLFGTTFITSSKPGRAPAGAVALRHVVRATTVPVLAVGGVTADNLPEVASAGAAGFAAIGFFADRRGLAARLDVARRAWRG